MSSLFHAHTPIRIQAPVSPRAADLDTEALAQNLLSLACAQCMGCEGLDWECLRLKAALVARIQQEMHNQGLSQTAAARRMGIGQPEVSRLLAGKLHHTSERKLMGCLNRLGFDIELSIRPAASGAGQVRVCD